MKVLILLLFLVYTSFAISSVDAAFVLGFHEDYPTALAQAKNENRALMLVIIKDPCPHSERMVYSTLSDPKVVEVLKDFVSVIVDKQALVPSQFKVELAPTIFFVNPQKEEVIRERIGYAPVDQFLDDLKEAHIFYNEK